MPAGPGRGVDADLRFYARRMASRSNFPIFPLGLVALPKEAVPLHIFEERYKSMIAFCLEHESEFGIVWTDESGLREIGCAVEVEEVLDRTPDGRLDILCRGTRRFELISRTETLAYPAGEVEFLDDEPDATDATEAAEAVRSLYSDLYTQATDRELEDEELFALDSYAMAATVEFGVDAKQTLLELRSENARMKLLEKLFRAALKRVDDVGAAEALARSNGKVRFGPNAA
jgi:hypothetical protein